MKHLDIVLSRGPLFAEPLPRSASPEARLERHRALWYGSRLLGSFNSTPPLVCEAPAWATVGAMVEVDRTEVSERIMASMGMASKPMRVVAVSRTMCLLENEDGENPLTTEQLAKYWHPAKTPA